MVVAQGLRLDALDDLLGLGNEFVQLFIRADVELSEAAEERHTRLNAVELVK
jgi:hypothetical protein